MKSKPFSLITTHSKASDAVMTGSALYQFNKTRVVESSPLINIYIRQTFPVSQGSSCIYPSPLLNPYQGYLPSQQTATAPLKDNTWYSPIEYNTARYDSSGNIGGDTVHIYKKTSNYSFGSINHTKRT